MNATIETNNWLSYQVSSEWEEEARQIRMGRDKQYGNIFREVKSDIRWVGDLGEICFNHWLRQNEIPEFTWNMRNAAGNPDFIISGVRIDVKTVKRKVPPRPEYTAQVTARHKDHPIDELFFLSYEMPLKKLCLLL